MGKSSHRQPPPQKPAMELSPQRAEDFRSQVSRETWRYAAQGPLAGKVKPHVLRLGRRDEQGGASGSRVGLKAVLLLLIVATIGISAAWFVGQNELARWRERRSSRAPGHRAPLDARPAIPGQGDDLPPPIVPPEIGWVPQPGEGPNPGALDQGPEPWAHVLAARGEPPPFEAVCFGDFPLDQRGLKFRARWLTPLDGQSSLHKLRAPWPAGTALRLAVKPGESFRIHIYGGDAAVTLDCASPRTTWAAYASVATPGQSSRHAPRAVDGTRSVPATMTDRGRPEPAALIGSDNDRYSRTGFGPISLHYHDGQLVMTRGNVRLLSAPLPAQPSEVYFEGSALWRGIALFRCGPPPPEDEPRPVVLRSDKPAKLPWTFNSIRGAELEKRDDGTVRLASQRAASDALATFRVTEPSLHEVVVQVADMQPGTGIFLGDKEGKPIHRIGFLREQPGGRLTAEYSPPGERRDQATYPTHAQPPLVRPGQWFRLVLGLGTFKAWTSADGVHWARLPSPPRGTPLGYGTIGLYCLPGEQERAIALAHLEIRELAALTSLASADARERAISLENVVDLPSWLQGVAEHQPRGVGADDWRRACALRTLAGSPSRELGAALLESLVREAIAQGDRGAPAVAQVATGNGGDAADKGPEVRETTDSRLAVLQEAALLWDAWDDDGAARLLRCYDRFGAALVREGRPGRSALLASALARSEIWTAETPRPGDILRGPCAKSELLEYVTAANWPAVRELRAQLDYWRWPGDATSPNLWQPRELTPWIEWSGYLAARAGGVKAAAPLAEEGDLPRGPRSGRWPRRVLTEEERREIERRKSSRHPLIEEISKDGFSLMAEFEASLSGDAYDDACQTAMTADAQAALGLLPWTKDPQLSLTFPAAVALAMQTHPGLRQTMLERFAAPGLVRLRQAKLAGDVAAVQATTVHLVGTQAASEAHHFLGDQALAAGDCDAAVGHYTLAMRDAPADTRKLIAAMLRLAGAMSGRDVGEKPKEPIDFGGTRLGPDEFEQLVREHLDRRGREGGALAVFDGRAASSVPPPTHFELRPFCDWPMRGRDPYSPAAVDSIGRQFAVALGTDTMYVQERDHVKALNLANGKERWASRLRETGFHPQWNGIAFRPCVAGGRVFVRQSFQEGGQILCFNAADGSLKWPERRFASRPDDGRLVSDPLVIGDGLYVFTVFDEPDNNPGTASPTLDLRLIVLDPATGETRRRHSLLRLQARENWGRPARIVCNAVIAQDQIIATVGGCVLCCDTSGQARWVRKQTLLPHTLPDVAASSLAQPQEPPLVLGDRLYVAQRDVRAAECLDLHTGRLHWRYVSPDVRRVAGATGETAVVETTDGFVGLNAATGEVRWHRDIEHLLEARLCGASDGTHGEFVYARRDALFGGQSRPSLVWLDLRTGRDTAVLPLPELLGREAVAGPFVRQGNRTWLFSGENTLDTKRRMWELLPRGPRLPAMNEETALKFYLPDSPSEADGALRGDVAAAVGWTLLSSPSDPRTGWQAKWQNEPDVAVTLAGPGRPVRLLRQVAVPPKGPAKLAIQVGHEPSERWELEITVAGKSAIRCEVSPKTASGGWLRRDIDLTAFAGQTVWLSATAGALDGQPAHAAWRKLEPPAERGASAP